MTDDQLEDKAFVDRLVKEAKSIGWEADDYIEVQKFVKLVAAKYDVKVKYEDLKPDNDMRD